MRANIVIWWILAGFGYVTGTIYTVWNIRALGHIEWTGTLSLVGVGLLSTLLALFLQRVLSGQGGPLPEDRADADIVDGDAELGHYSPWSWWPIILAGAVAVVFLGVCIGVWLFAIGAAVTTIALVGWVFEYYRGPAAH